MIPRSIGFRTLVFAGTIIGCLMFDTARLPAALVGIQSPATPDFSGTWTLDLAGSDYGPFEPPQRRTDVIEHRAALLKVTRREVTVAGEERVGEWICTTDGTECANTIRATGMKSRARWDETALVVLTNTSYQGQDASIEDRWTLSPDRQVLTIARHAQSPAGHAAQTFVFRRQ